MRGYNFLCLFNFAGHRIKLEDISHLSVFWSMKNHARIVLIFSDIHLRKAIAVRKEDCFS
jgi:hypothetical protein